MDDWKDSNLPISAIAMGRVILVAITGTTVSSSQVTTTHLNIQAPVDEICGGPIWNQVAVTCRYDRVPG